MKVNPAQIGGKPYRFNGLVLTDEGRGSGFCAWNKRTFFSAAHVVFGETEWLAPPTWTPSPNAEVLEGTDGYFLHQTGPAITEFEGFLAKP